MKALSNRSAMFFMFCNLHNGFVRWNACWASITTRLTWNKDTSISEQNKKKKENPNKSKPDKVKIYRLIFLLLLLFFPHRLTVNRTHDASDPCSALSGYFLTIIIIKKKKTVDIWSTTTHTKNKHRFHVVSKLQICSKDMKSLERHIQLIINVPFVICLSSKRLSLIQIRRKMWRSAWLVMMVLFMNAKIHLQPEYWDKQFTVTNLHTRIDSYLVECRKLFFTYTQFFCILYIITAFPEKNESVLSYVLIQQNISVQPKEEDIPFIKIYTHILLSIVNCVSIYIFLMEKEKNYFHLNLILDKKITDLHS